MNKNTLEFVAIMQSEFPAIKAMVLVEDCIKILKLAQRHQNLATTYCDVGLTEREHKQFHFTIEQKLKEISAQSFDGKLGFILSGDPRGCTIKLTVPSGQTNDWGREGICVPVK